MGKRQLTGSVTPRTVNVSFYKLRSHPVYDPSLNGEHECITGFWRAHFAGKIDIYMLITVLKMVAAVSAYILYKIGIYICFSLFVYK